MKPDCPAPPLKKNKKQVPGLASVTGFRFFFPFFSLLLAAALFAGALGFAVPASAAVLVSNIDRSTHGNSSLISSDLAQGFTTGTNADGYTLDSVEVRFRSTPSSLTVTLATGVSSTSAGTTVATLNNPSSLTSGNLTFTAPAGTRLLASTKYWVVIEGSGGSLRNTKSADEDPGGAAGWSIENDGNARLARSTGGWSTRNEASMIRINGSIGLTTNSAPTFPTTAPTSLSVAENNAAGATVGTVAATDPDSGDTLTYSLDSTSDAVFDIDGSGTITVTSANALDRETKASHSVTVSVHDGKNSSGGPDTSVDDTHNVTINVTNVEEPPGKPTGVTVSNPTSSSLRVSWTAPSDTGALAITDYDVRYFAGSTDPSNAGDWIEPGEPGGHDHMGTAVMTTITGLSASTSYRVQIRAIGDGSGSWSDSGGGNTPPSFLGATVNGITLKITFDETLDSGSEPPASAFTVTVNGSSRTVSDVSISGTVVTLTLSSAATLTDTVRVAYTKPTGASVNKLRDTSANQNEVNTFGAQFVLSVPNTNNTPPVVTLALSSSSIGENGGSTTVTATLDRVSDEDTTVTVSAAAVSPATSGDFTLSTNKVLTIAVGQTTSTGTVTITAVNNNTDSPNKSVTVSGSAVNTVGVTDPASVTLGITDDDATPTVTLALSPSAIGEDGGESTVTATLSHPSSARTSVTVSAAAVSPATADDFTLSANTTLTIAAGETDSTGAVTITAVDNDVDAADKTVTVSATASDNVNAPSDQTLTITDDDEGSMPAVTLVLTPASIDENGGVSTVTATLDRVSGEETTVTVSAAAVSPAMASDFTLSDNKTLTIAAGATASTGAVTITAVDNDVDAADKTVTVSATVSGNVSAPSDRTLTITDDDEGSMPAAMVISIADAGEVSEGDAGSGARAEFAVTLSAAGSGEVTVNYATAGDTATEGVDYVAASGTLTFAPGESGTNVRVQIIGDVETEGNERFFLRLSSPSSNAELSRDAEAEAIILNDDRAEISGPREPFMVGETTVAVVVTETDVDPRVILPPVLEQGGEVIEDLTVTISPSGQEITGRRFGVSESLEDHSVVDIEIHPNPDADVRICLPLTEALREQAGGRRLFLIRYSGGSWRELTNSMVSGDAVCADTGGFFPFAVTYEETPPKRPVTTVVTAEFLRATVSSVVEAVTRRIEEVTSRRGKSIDFNLGASPAAERYFGPAMEEEYERDPSVSLTETLAGSSFSVNLAGGGLRRALENGSGSGPLFASQASEEPVGAPSWGGFGIWASGDYRNLSGGSGPVDWDGRVIGGHVGADIRIGSGTLAGVAASLLRGSFDYSMSGEQESSIAAVHPYLAWTSGRRLTVWAIGGFGFGDVEEEGQKADAVMRTLAVGGKVNLLSSAAGAVDLKAEGWLSRLSVEDNGDGIEKSDVDAHRLRLALRGSTHVALLSGVLTPSVELGARRDGGDGETGMGGEVAGAMTYLSPFGLSGLSIEARGRTLLFHGGDLKEWGVGGAIRFDSGTDGRGFFVNVLPSWGDYRGGVERFWDRDVTENLAGTYSPALRLDTEVGYAVAAFEGRGAFTPYAGTERLESGSSYRVGSRLNMGSIFDLEVRGERMQAPPPQTTRHQLTLRGRVNW